MRFLHDKMQPISLSLLTGQSHTVNISTLGLVCMETFSGRVPPWASKVVMSQKPGIKASQPGALMYLVW